MVLPTPICFLIFEGTSLFCAFLKKEEGVAFGGKGTVSSRCSRNTKRIGSTENDTARGFESASLARAGDLAQSHHGPCA